MTRIFFKDDKYILISSGNVYMPPEADRCEIDSMGVTFTFTFGTPDGLTVFRSDFEQAITSSNIVGAGLTMDIGILPGSDSKRWRLSASFVATGQQSPSRMISYAFYSETQSL